jgi:hypothetical protein
MKSIIYWDMTPCSPSSFNRRFGGTYRLHFPGRRNKFSKNQHLFLRPRRWRRYVLPKRRLKLDQLHGVISQKKILFKSFRVINRVSCSTRLALPPLLGDDVMSVMFARNFYTISSRPSQPGPRGERWVLGQDNTDHQKSPTVPRTVCYQYSMRTQGSSHDMTETSKTSGTNTPLIQLIAW